MILPFLGFAWIAGLAAVAAWGASPWLAAAALALLAPLAAAVRSPRIAGIVLVAASLALLAGLRFESWEERGAPGLARWVGSEIEVRGEVVSEPDPSLTTTAYRVDASHIRTAGSQWQPADGGLLIRVGQYTDYDVGSRVTVAGELEAAPVFEDFDYRGYLARQGVVGTMLFPDVAVTAEPGRWDVGRALAEARLGLDHALQRSLPEPQASLGAGIAFGRDGNLPRDLYDDFRTTGLAHIVAVSGANVALVTAMTFVALRRFVGRKQALIPAVFAVAAYLALTGFTPSVVRAGVMAMVYLGGTALGRPQSALPALALAAIAMTALDPGLARDVGFQLSLSATAGLIVFGPWVRWALERLAIATRLGGWIPRVVLDVAAISVSATMATLPITWINFGQFSVIGPLANLVVDPLFVAAFWLSVLTAFVGAAWEPAGYVLGLAAYYPLAAMVWVAETLAGVPGAAVALPEANADHAVLAFLVMAAVAVPAYRRLAPIAGRQDLPGPGKAARIVAWGAAAGMAVALVSLLSLRPIGGPGRLEVAVLDVGQGDAILVTTPGGERVLVDGGPSGIELARELGALLPHWERTIDRVVLTHPDADHYGGLPELSARFDIGMLYEGALDRDADGYAELRQREPRSELLEEGGGFEVDGVRFEVVWPPGLFDGTSTNDLSLVLLLTYGDVQVLLTADIERYPQDALLRQLDDVDVLKVPHHGSATSSEAFLRGTGASVAVISVGSGNQFGHPAEETLAALAGTRLYRTDEDGRVVIRTDGISISVDTER